MPTSAQTHAEAELAAQLEAARTAAGEALDAALLAFGQVQEQLAALAQERDALRADLATARRDLDLARGLIARLGDLDALESLAVVNESLRRERDEARAKLTECHRLAWPRGGDLNGDPVCDLMLAFGTMQCTTRDALAERDEARGRVAELERERDEWAQKDGNSPGYNKEKAQTYGRIAHEERQRADRAEARVAELEREVKLREAQTQRMMLARDAVQRERDTARARVAELEAAGDLTHTALAATEPKGGAT